MADNQKLKCHVESVRLDRHVSRSTCKQAVIALDTDPAGSVDAFNPAELLLSALSACMLKSIERVTPILKFELRGVAVAVDGVRKIHRPRWSRFAAPSRWAPTIAISCSSSCTKTSKFGTVFNAIAPGTDLQGVLIRKTRHV